MKITKTIDVGDKKVIIRELTVSELRQWIADTEEIDTNDIITLAIVDGMSLKDLRQMTNLTEDEINEMSPSTLVNIADTCKKVNASFFQMLERIKKVVPQLSANSTIQ